MKTTLRMLVVAALTAGSMAVSAAPVQYQFTSSLAPVAPNTGANFSGYVEFDSSLLAPNAVIPVASFSDWEFIWGNTFTDNAASHQFDPGASLFQLDAALQAASVALCFSVDGNCLTGSHPVGLVLSNLVFATTSTSDQAQASGSWSGPVAGVPEPATLALAGLALAGLALGRRRQA